MTLTISAVTWLEREFELVWRDFGITTYLVSSGGYLFEVDVEVDDWLDDWPVVGCGLVRHQVNTSGARNVYPHLFSRSGYYQQMISIKPDVEADHDDWYCHGGVIDERGLYGCHTLLAAAPLRDWEPW